MEWVREESNAGFEEGTSAGIASAGTKAEGSKLLTGNFYNARGNLETKGTVFGIARTSMIMSNIAAGGLSRKGRFGRMRRQACSKVAS